MFQDFRKKSDSSLKGQSQKDPGKTQFADLRPEIKAQERLKKLLDERALSKTQTSICPKAEAKYAGWREMDQTPDKVRKIDIFDEFLPRSLKPTGRYVNRKIFVGSDIQNYGFLPCRKTKSVTIFFEEVSVQQYRVTDSAFKFFTAVRTNAVHNILTRGLDPDFGNVDYPQTSSEYNTKGFNYFGATRRIPKLYGENVIAPEEYTVLYFQLPEGTLVERDPEIPEGLRTTSYIRF
ncbi:MAG: hypothetical protein MI784_17705 [Cytophagales bacterium]|nr:hypothetical protein [Cytophagales bacterium]